MRPVSCVISTKKGRTRVHQEVSTREVTLRRLCPFTLNINQMYRGSLVYIPWFLTFLTGNQERQLRTSKKNVRENRRFLRGMSIERVYSGVNQVLFVSMSGDYVTVTIKGLLSRKGRSR